MAYYYQIGRDINNSDKASELANWRTTDLDLLPKDDCMNVNDVNYNKTGSQSMKKDDNEAMFVPKGYAILGYDHEDCNDEAGKGVQFYHGNHQSEAGNTTATAAISAITDNQPGGVYNYYGPNGGDDEDQPRNIAGKLSSWKVYNLNDETDLENVISALTSLGSKSGPIAANKQSIKKTICENIDKNIFKATRTGGERLAFTDICDGILNPIELKRVWPDETPDVSAAPDTYSDPDDDDTYSDPDDDDTYSDPDDDPYPDPEDDPDPEGTDWLLYGGIAAGVCSVVVVLIIIVLMMKKKKSRLNAPLN